MSNPYDSKVIDHQTASPKGPRILDWVIWCFCCLPAICCVGLWLSAFAALGHTPIPNRDYPSQIDSSLFRILNSFFDMLCRITAPVAFVGVILQLSQGGRNWRRRALFAFTTVLIFVVVLFFLVFEPTGTFSWFLKQNPPR